ncbi:MAG: hypothetical protein DME04_09565 [Candidatus Rokuibacteriota bacterium]|nr:MAG: hypothetical protein DME04_09565 [Candidatus Rokubacteria bacterium]
MLSRARVVGWTRFVLVAIASTVSIIVPRGPAFGQADLPSVFLDTAYSPPTTGRLITVSAGGNFQDALNRAQPGDIIDLQAGETFTPDPLTPGSLSGSFTLPNKAGAGWIYVRSSAHDQLPPAGARVTSANANLMPKIVSPAGLPAIKTDTGAHHYRFVGIEVKPAAGVVVSDLIALGTGAELLEGDLPHDIIFDRCYIHGDSSVGGKRGIALNSKATAVIDSYLADFKLVNQDSQAIAGWNGPGPFRIANNYLEGAGENVLFGGADPRILGLVPSDIDIRGNYFFKPSSWRPGDPSYAGTPWTVKTLLDLENARRVLIEGNVFENNWAGDYHGTAIRVTVRNSQGTAPWATVTDVTLRYNIVKLAAAGIAIYGRDDRNSSQATERIVVRDNRFYDIDSSRGGGDPAITNAGRLYEMRTSVPAAPNFVTIDHNTGDSEDGVPVGGVLVAGEGPPGTAASFVYKNNIAPRGQYGVSGPPGSGEGSATLDTYFPDHVFARNVIWGPSFSCAIYPAETFCPSASIDIGFVDRANQNYRLAPGTPYKNLGTDGKDIGADIDALETMTVGAVSGASNPPTPVRENVVWTNLVNVIAHGNSLQKTSGCDGCEDAGATSVQQITGPDGYVEFTASEPTTLRALGLSNGNTDMTAADIDFAIALWPFGGTDVRENDVWPPDSPSLTRYVPGDVFRIAVESRVVRYYKNGTLLYESKNAPLFPLLVDTTLLTMNSTITNAVILRYR